MLKSIIPVLLSIFLNFSLSLAGDLKLSFDVEPAWIPRAASCEYLPPKEILYKANNNSFCLTLKPAFEWKILYGNIDLTAFSASPKKGMNFVPFRMSYSNEIGLKYQFSSFTLSGGWVHNCQHQVIIATYTDSNVDTRKIWNDAGYDKVFIRFHFSNSVK